MFKMKYLMNKMKCNILLQQVGWFASKGVCPIPKVKGSNLNMNGVVCGQQWYVD
jgi:hypothetical protein